MAWELRGKQKYYYRKQRIGDKVLSKYLGKGETSDLLALVAQGRQDEKRLNQEKERLERWEVEEIELSLDAVFDLIQALTKGVLLISGHHTHKGEWRRKRNEEDRTQAH